MVLIYEVTHNVLLIVPPFIPEFPKSSCSTIFSST